MSASGTKTKSSSAGNTEGTCSWLRKASMRERYTELTRGLDWNPSYVTQEELYPYTRFEGIKIHDWDEWEDPFRLTVDAYYKYQAEKDKRLYAVLDAFAQSQGHLVADRRPLPQRVEAVSAGRDPAGVRRAPALRVPGPPPQRPGPAVRRAVPVHRRVAAQSDPDTRFATTTSTTTACTTCRQHARPGLVPVGAEVVLRRRA